MEKKPKVLEDGSTDYKNVDNIRQVKAGEVLAIKHSAVPGKAGMDIFGHETLPQPVNDVLFKKGTNTSISEDGFRLIADKAGFLYYSSGEICVGDVYVVNGDVDFKTGNIRYQGDILVKGDVASGFTVDADGSVVVEGSMETGAIVSRRGSVEIQQGVFGQGNCRISAHGDIRVKSAQDVRFECGGAFEVEKGIRNCQVVAGSVKADRKGCYVIGGALKSYAEISIAAVGAEGCRTEIQIVDKQAEAARLRIREIDLQRQEGLPKLARLDKQLKDLAGKAGKLGGQALKDWRVEMGQVLSEHGRLEKSLAPLDEERKKLSECLFSESGNATMSVTEKVVQGVRLSLYGAVAELTTEDARKSWHLTADGLVGNPLNP